MEPERLIIAHDEPLARGYLRLLVRRELPTVDCFEVATFEALLARLRGPDRFELALIDLDLPGMSRDVGLHFLLKQHPETRIVVLFKRLSGDKLRELSEDGVAALAPCQAPEATLAQMLHKVVAKVGLVIAEGALTGPGKAATSPGEAQHLGLTERQHEVVRLLSLGFSNREIGRMLGITEGTVKTHVNAAFKILGVRNRVGAAMAIRSLILNGKSPTG